MKQGRKLESHKAVTFLAYPVGATAAATGLCTNADLACGRRTLTTITTTRRRI